MSDDPNELDDLEPPQAHEVKGGTGWRDRRPVEGTPEAELSTQPNVEA